MGNPQSRGGGGGEQNPACLTDGSGAMGSMLSRAMRARNQKLRSQTWTVVASIVPRAGLMALFVPRN